MKTIFISSTFKDMQFERDILNRKVLPKINDEANKYYESVSLCDLRWGINTNAMDDVSSNKKILDSCLFEIDNCRPYMICFLGERYGWIPGEELIKYTVENHSLLDLENYDISVTELEIQYGAFFNPTKFERTLFYFRNIDDLSYENVPGEVYNSYVEKNEEAKNKLLLLKDKIKKIPNSHIRDYNIKWNNDDKCWDGYNELSEMIVSDVISLMEKEWKEYTNLTPLEREIKIHKEHAYNQTNSFHKRHTNVDKINYLLDNNQKLLLVSGSNGCGLSSVMSKIIIDRIDKNINVIPIFCGLTHNSNDEIKIIKYIISYLNNLLNKSIQLYETDNVELWMGVLCEAIEQCELIPCKVEIIIDSIDIFSYNHISESIIYKVLSVVKIPDNLSIVFGVSKKDFYGSDLPFVYALNDLDYFDAYRICKSVLSKTRKELDESVIKELFIKKDSRLPLYIEMIIRRLSIMERSDFEIINSNGGDIKAIIEHQKRIINDCPDTLEELCMEITKIAGERINKELSDYVISYICSSEYGISEERLKEILARKNIEWSNLDFRVLLRYLEGFFFMDEEGYYKMKHPSMYSKMKIDNSYYLDLLENLDIEFETKEITERLVSLYVYYSIFSCDYRRYLGLFIPKFKVENINKYVKWLSKATYFSLEKKLNGKLSESDISDILEGFIDDLLKIEDMNEQINKFIDMFINNLYSHYSIKKYRWRIMGYKLFKSWDTVNMYQKQVESKNKFNLFVNENIYESYKNQYFNLSENWEKIALKNVTDIRFEHIISKEYRDCEIDINGKLYYLFGVPTKQDSTLFLMCDNMVVNKFYRSSVGDHCTYDMRYESDTDILIVEEADFSHYDIETTITRYEYKNPGNSFGNCTVTYSDRRGAYNLPYYFKIK